jgi:DNA polymerase-1
MARKNSRVFEPVSIPLEDKMPVQYKVVGTSNWFASAFKPGAVLDSEKIVISDSSDLASTKAWVNAQKALGADTETTGKFIKGNKGYSMNPVNEGTKLVLLQLGTEEMTYLIDPDLAEEFKEPLESKRILKILQNALYDFKWLLTKKGIHLDRVYDTMLAEQVLTAGMMGVRVGLADLARKYDPFYLISKAVRSRFVELADGQMDRDMVYYAARDIPLMFPIFRAQLGPLKEKKLDVTAQLEFNCIPCTAEMELGGVYLKEDKLKLLIKFWLERQIEMEQEILGLYDTEMRGRGLSTNFLIPELSEVFDLNSGPQKLEALRMLGFELDDTKRETLMTIDHPLAKKLGEYSNVTKMTSTYGTNMLEKINEFTGMWHPRFAQMGSGEMEAASGRDNTTTTATGRYVSDAQQFPKKTERYAIEKDQAVLAAIYDIFSKEIGDAEALLKDKAA